MKLKSIGYLLLLLLPVFIIYTLINTKDSPLVTNIDSTSQTAQISGSSSGLVAHYTFDDGTATDSSGNGNNGTIIGATPTTGKIGGGMSFDGVDDYVDIPTVPVSSYPFTVSAWIKTDSTGGAVFSLGNDTSGIPYYRVALTSGSAFAGARHSSGNESQAIGTTNLVDGWHHVVGVFSSNTSRTVYVNGVLEGTNTTDRPFNPVNTASIGVTERSSMLSFFDGIIDDVRIYNRTLSNSEIEQIYTSGGGAVTQNPTSTPGDISGPIISSISASNITSNSATISWTTDEPSDTQIFYDRTTAYGSQTGRLPALTTSHTQTLTNLQPNSEYNYYVRSEDASGNVTVSGNQTFRTLQTTQLSSSILTVKKDGTGNYTTIQACLDNAQPGNTCLVSPGVYTESPVFSRPGTAGNLIKLSAEYQLNKNNNFNRTIVEGKVTLKNYNGVYGIEVINNGIVIDGSGSEVLGNYIHGVGDRSAGTAVQIVRTSPVSVPYHSNISIKNNYIEQMSYGVIIHCSSNCLIEGNDIKRLYTPVADRPTGIRSGDVDYVRMFGNGITFKNNKLHGSSLSEIDEDAHVDGIQTFTNGGLGGQDRDTLSNTIIEGNHIQDSHQAIWWTTLRLSYNGQPMISSNVTIRNNLFINSWGTNARMSIGGDGVDDLYIYNNIFRQSVRIIAKNRAIIKNNVFFGNFMNNSDDRFSWPQRSYEISHNIIFFDGWINEGIRDKYPDLAATNIFDPDRNLIFLDYDNHDFHLKSGSLAIDSGINLSHTGFSYDKEGRNRPQSGLWDIGAYEYGATRSSNNPSTPSVNTGDDGEDIDVSDEVIERAVSTPTPRVTAPVVETTPDTPTTPTTTTVPTRISLTRNLTLGYTGTDVRSLQQFLNAKGFTVSTTGGGSPGNETTYFGPATRSALARYQASKGITPAVGFLGPITIASINSETVSISTPTTTTIPTTTTASFTRNLTLGSRGLDVLALQKFLNAKGFTVSTSGAGSVGNETTYFGPATRSALARYQASRNITPSVGYFGPLTRAKVVGE